MTSDFKKTTKYVLNFKLRAYHNEYNYCLITTFRFSSGLLIYYTSLTHGSSISKKIPQRGYLNTSGYFLILFLENNLILNTLKYYSIYFLLYNNVLSYFIISDILKMFKFSFHFYYVCNFTFLLSCCKLD